jgi:hypothetical protein
VPLLSEETALSLATWLRGASLAGMVLVALLTIYSGVQFGWVNWKALKLHDLS